MSTDEAAPAPQTPERACPICGAMSVRAFRPFCSKRCADVDLHRWLSGVYVIPVREEDEADGRSAPPSVPGD